MIPISAGTERKPVSFFYTSCIFSVLFLLTACVFFSCKLDENAMRQDTLNHIGGSEKMFFLEEVTSNTVDTDLSELAREASRFGYVQVMRYLQGRGADLNQADAYGWSPILIAASRGDLPLIRFLAEIAGADLRAKTRSRTSTLMLAARTGGVDVCRYLLDRGVNVATKSNHGMTALMYAAGSGNVDLAKLLVERGADTQVINSFNGNALSYAESQPMKDYLVSLGLQVLPVTKNKQ